MGDDFDRLFGAEQCRYRRACAADPPDHTRRRKVVNPAFAPKRTQLLLEAAGKKVDALIDRLDDRGEFDAMNELCKPLSVEVLLRNFMAIDDKDHRSS